MSPATASAADAFVIDWPKMIDEMQHLLGEPLGFEPGALRTWLDGAEPKHSAGEKLIRRWCSLTGKARPFLPMTSATQR